MGKNYKDFEDSDEQETKKEEEEMGDLTILKNAALLYSRALKVLFRAED